MDNWLEIAKQWRLFASGLGVTVMASLMSLGLALAIGTLFGVIQASRLPVAPAIARAYVEFFQNTPLLVQMYFIFFGLPVLGVRWSALTVGVVGLSVYTGAYISEVIRAGIQAVPRGQLEACLSQGMSYVQAMRHVVLPQAFRIILPPLTNQLINLIKNSALLTVFAGRDLLYEAETWLTQSYIVLETYVVVAVLYLCLTLPLARLVGRLERRLVSRA